MTLRARYIAIGLTALAAYAVLILGLYRVSSAPVESASPRHVPILAKGDRLDVCMDVCRLTGSAP